MLITPEYVFKDVTHITPEWLAQKGIRALVLDIDNTLTADRSQELPEEVAGWLEAMHRAGVKRRQMAMVGDQLYADRMAAALYGIPGLMVIPRGPDLGAQVVLKRRWEKKHWQEYYDQGGKTL